MGSGSSRFTADIKIQHNAKRDRQKCGQLFRGSTEKITVVHKYATGDIVNAVREHILLAGADGHAQLAKIRKTAGAADVFTEHVGTVSVGLIVYVADDLWQDRK
jgi:hypothetical protein